MDIDLDAVRDRWEALAQPGAVSALRADREAQIVSERWMESRSEEHHPEPYWQQQLGRSAGRPLDGPADTGVRLGINSDGRVVLAQHLGRGEEMSCDLLTWTQDTVEVVDRIREGGRGELRVMTFAGDRALMLAACQGGRRLDGRPKLEVVRYDYDEKGRLALGLRVYESGSDRCWGGPEKGPYWGATATRFTHDADGALALVEHLWGGPELAHGQDVEAALVEAHAEVTASHLQSSVVYDARISAREDVLPEPAQAFAGVAEPLGDAVQRAVVETRLDDLAFVSSTSSRAAPRETCCGRRSRTPRSAIAPARWPTLLSACSISRTRAARAACRWTCSPP